MNKEDMIYDLLKNVRDDVKEIRVEQVRQGEHISRNTSDLKDQEEIIYLNKKELDKKIQTLQDNIKRPRVNWGWIKSNIIWIITVGSGITGIIWQISRIL